MPKIKVKILRKFGPEHVGDFQVYDDEWPIKKCIKHYNDKFGEYPKLIIIPKNKRQIWIGPIPTKWRDRVEERHNAKHGGGSPTERLSRSRKIVTSAGSVSSPMSTKSKKKYKGVNDNESEVH